MVMCMALIQASAFMHLTNAGMGQPDWPAGYGVIATEADGVEAVAGSGHTAARAIAPAGIADRVHRLVANILQLLIVAVAFSAFRHRKDGRISHPLFLPVSALVLSLLLAFLGAWFGSPLRYPWIMMVNLTGGMVLLAIFWWLTLDFLPGSAPSPNRAKALFPWAVWGLVMIGVQVFLGAWVDAYYAAITCTGLPGCVGVDWSWNDLFRGLGMLGYLQLDGSGKVLTDEAVAAAVHMAHRLWAVFSILYLGWLGWRVLGLGGRMRLTGMTMMVLLPVQAGLGLAMVMFSMPLAFVVSHTVVASLLVIGVLTLIHLSVAARGA